MCSTAEHLHFQALFSPIPFLYYVTPSSPNVCPRFICSCSQFGTSMEFTTTYYLIGVAVWITTECERLQNCLGEIVILTQGYVAETFGTHFQLPDLEPIGALENAKLLAIYTVDNFRSN